MAPNAYCSWKTNVSGLARFVFMTALLAVAGCESEGGGEEEEVAHVTDNDAGMPGEEDEDAGSNGDEDTDSGLDTEVDTEIETEISCDDDNRYWIWDFSSMPPQDVQICATVRGTGDNVYALVADDLWGDAVDQQMVDRLILAWDAPVPGKSKMGIFDSVTSLFGAPPDEFDDDPRIYLFLYEMEGFGGFAFDGYFRNSDQQDGLASNRREMLHINTGVNQPDGDYSLSVQAHEFQHLIHYGLDPYEYLWFDEAMSELAMVVAGFGADEGYVSAWLQNPSGVLMCNIP